MGSRVFFSVLICLVLLSCSHVIRVDDVLTQTTTYQWSSNLRIKSTKLRLSRNFHVYLEKEHHSNEYVRIDIRSHFPITKEDYDNKVFFVFGNNSMDFELYFLRDNIQYAEAIERVTTATTSRTDITTVKSAGTEPTNATQSNVEKATKTSDTTTTTSTNTNTNVSLNKSIVDKVNSERSFYVPIDIFNAALLSDQLVIRLYNENKSDFWNIRISDSVRAKWKNLSEHKYKNIRT
jgi:hypothetical protein